MNQITKKKLELDKPVFIAGALLSLVPVFMFLLMGEKGNDVINSLNLFLTRETGFIFTIEGFVFLAFPLYVAFSKLGKLKLGAPDEKPEFGFFKWGAIMFSSGISSSIFWAASSEWIYYLQSPPLGIEPFSIEALRLAPGLSMFHWGPMIWGSYMTSAIVVAYLFQIKRQPVLKISEATSLVYKGKPYEKKVNSLVDILMIATLILSSATSLGLGTPYVSAAVSVVTGIPDSVALRLGVMGVVVVIFAISSAAGMKKGMAFIADLNLKIATGLIIFVLISGPTKMIIENFITSAGLMGSNFLTLSTFMEPFESASNFHSDWTAFFWAWTSSAAPVQGAYFARISKGRTLRSMIIGCFIYGSIACMTIIATISGLGINLYLNNSFDSPAKFAEGGNLNLVVMEMFKNHLPLGTVFVSFLIISCIIFLATTFDAFSFSLGAFTTKQITPEQEPEKWNKLFWAAMIGAIPFVVILFNGNLKSIQSTAIPAGLMSMVFLFMMIYGFIKETNKDKVYILRRLREQEEFEIASIEKETGLKVYGGTSKELNPYENS